MPFSSMCVLKCAGYSYRFNFEDIVEAVSVEFPGLPLDFSRIPRANCSVLNGQLYLNSLRLFVLAKDLGKSLCFPHFARYQRKELAFSGKYLCDIENSYSVSYEKLHIPLQVTKAIPSRQIFVDEVELTQTPHKEISTFVFAQGKVDLDRSHILQSNERLIEQYIWRDGMENDLMDDEITDMGCCRIFFINPVVGTLAQNHHVINAAAAYKRCPGFEEPAVKAILRHKKPVLRTEYMKETFPRSCKFEHRIDDVSEIVSQYIKAEKPSE